MDSMMISDPCLSNPCLHGKCLTTRDGNYRCRCLPKATGKNCKVISKGIGDI